MSREAARVTASPTSAWCLDFTQPASAPSVGATCGVPAAVDRASGAALCAVWGVEQRTEGEVAVGARRG